MEDTVSDPTPPAPRRSLQSKVQAADPIWVKILMTFPILMSSLYVILSQHYSQTEKNWAFGVAGTILGYWMRK
jgi:hypothetical protein